MVDGGGGCAASGHSGQVPPLTGSCKSHCGSWLACDSGVSVNTCAGWHTAIAGKPAPTLIFIV
ncbi:hypothetical protein EJJ20_20580 [Pseudomonas poae]|nr:hypothetical protein EJJ20_20580 [Pseudomonas poae]